MQIGLAFPEHHAIYGSLIPTETLQLTGRPRAARYGDGAPVIASIDLAAADGGWHWACSVHTSTSGFGWALRRKWRRFEATREAALASAATYMRPRVSTAPEGERRAILEWLKSVETGRVA